MTLKQDLSALWTHTVRTGQIRSQFMGENGKQIEAGMRLRSDVPQHYAIDVPSGQEICAGLRERPIEGSPFTLQWNQYRALKPQASRLGTGRQPDSSPDSNHCFFACQDPANPLSLLRRSALLQMTLKNYQWVAVHNVLPVEKSGHFLWVPVRSYGAITAFPHYLQVLTLQFLQDFLFLASASNNLVTLFNSLHAGASVNHIHFHSVHHAHELAIEKISTISHGRHRFLNDYPVSGLVHHENTTVERIWSDIAKLQECGIPLNLLHVSGRTYLIARNIEHEVVEEFPGGILAGMELAGRVITTERTFYENADWTTIQTALRKSTLSQQQLLSILGS